MTRILNILTLISTLVAMPLLNKTDIFANQPDPSEPPTDLTPFPAPNSDNIILDNSDEFSDEDEDIQELLEDSGIINT